MANDIEIQLREMKKDIKDDVYKVGEEVRNTNKVLLDVSEKLTSSYEKLLDLQKENDIHSRKLDKHSFWLVIHSFILGFFFLLLMSLF